VAAPILTSQHNQLVEIARESGLDVVPEGNAAAAVWRFRPAPRRYAFVVTPEERLNHQVRTTHGYKVVRLPGERRVEETHWVPDWSGVVRSFSEWLSHLARELRAEDLVPDSAGAPEWLDAESPKRTIEIKEEIRRLRDEARTIAKITNLLWQTGKALNEAVRDAFRQIGYRAELTAPGATYDVTVDLDTSRRLLIEVTGIEDLVRKSSNKIGQVLQTKTKEANAGDRVVLAINAHRLTPLADRAQLEIVTPDALQLLTGLTAVTVSTVTFYRMWELAQTDSAAAKQLIEDLFAAPAGVFTPTI